MLSTDPFDKPSFPMLVVDFNINHRLLIEHYLSVCMPETQPVFKSTAEEAIAHLDMLTKQNLPLPKLILMDVYLPLFEAGWQLMRAIREDFPRLPLLILSRNNTADTVLEAYMLGIHSFIEKPDSLEGWEALFNDVAQYWLRTVMLPTR